MLSRALTCGDANLGVVAAKSGSPSPLPPSTIAIVAAVCGKGLFGASLSPIWPAGNGSSLCRRPRSPGRDSLLRQVSVQVLVSFRGNRAPVPPGRTSGPVSVTYRASAPPVQAFVTYRGVTVALHHRAAARTAPYDRVQRGRPGPRSPPPNRTAARKRIPLDPAARHTAHVSKMASGMNQERCCVRVYGATYLVETLEIDRCRKARRDGNDDSPLRTVDIEGPVFESGPLAHGPWSACSAASSPKPRPAPRS